MKFMVHMLVNMWCIIALNWVPHDPVWLIAVGVVMFGNLGLLIRGYIRGPQLTAEQKLEISRQKTAELEKDLGYEPLNLHELDDIVLDQHKNRKDS